MGDRRFRHFVAKPSAVACLLLTLLPKLALAAPTFRLSASGHCPTRAELETAALAKGWFVASGDSMSAYVIDAQSDGTGAVVAMQSSDGKPLLQRRIDSRDCQALAAAMLVVVEAYFVEIGEPVAAPAHNPSVPVATSPTSPSAPAADKAILPNTSTSNAPEVTADTVPVNTPELPAPRTPPMRAAAKGQLAQPAVGKSTAPPKTKETPAKTATDVQAIGRANAGIGVLFSLPSVPATPRVELGAGVDLPAWSFGTDVMLATSSQTASKLGKDRVNRWASQGLWRMTWLLTKSLPLRPWAGLGMSVVRLNATDLPGSPSRTTFSAVVGGGLEAFWPIGGNWFSRADVGCLVLGTRDQYYVANEEIGHGPRVACHATLGIAFSGERRAASALTAPRPVLFGRFR